jgi:UDP-glucose 4-epimerase
MKKEKVLVIGGSGFMGSHTADELSKKGYSVILFDKAPSKWRSNGQEMIIGDFMSTRELLKAMKGVSYVYHFGAIADIGEAKDNPKKTIESNVMGILSVLEALRQSDVKRFMYASTVYVYSNHGSFYRVSKQSAESIIEAYQEEFDVNFTLIRYGSLYGSRSQPWNGIKNFVNQVLKKGKIEYAGNGQEIREYINVSDAAKLGVSLLDEKYSNSAVMITGQQTIRAKELFSIIFEIYGAKEVVKYLNNGVRSDHYGNTPYRYTPKNAIKIVPSEFIDLGQGLLNVIEEVQIELDNEKN